MKNENEKCYLLMLAFFCENVESVCVCVCACVNDGSVTTREIHDAIHPSSVDVESAGWSWEETQFEDECCGGDRDDRAGGGRGIHHPGGDAGLHRAVRG